MYGSTIAPTHLKERNFAEAAAPHIAEFVGTYLLVFAIAVCGILAERSYGPTAIGSILTVLVYIFQPISGAYLNPAASVAAGLVGQIPWKTVMAYVVLQITAGFIAGLACYEVFHLPMGVAPVAPFEFGDAAFFGGPLHRHALLCDSKRDSIQDKQPLHQPEQLLRVGNWSCDSCGWSRCGQSLWGCVESSGRNWLRSWRSRGR